MGIDAFCVAEDEVVSSLQGTLESVGVVAEEVFLAEICVAADEGNPR